MRVFGLVLGVLLIACGGEEPTNLPSSPLPVAPAAGTNLAPVISSLELLPDAPRSSDSLSARLRAHDPERGSLQVEYEWYVNGRLVQSGERSTLAAGSARRGDRVHVVATASDGVDETSSQTAPVQVRNSPPVITKLMLESQRTTASDPILATAGATDEDGDPIEYRYTWYVNGRALEDVSGPALEAGRAGRGDQVSVAVRARDGTEEGESFRLPARQIANSPPEILSTPSYTITGTNTYRYQVKARDPDGDRHLRYELLQAPEGMRVDLLSGLVTWVVPADAGGKYPVELVVSDAYGGRTGQSYVLELDWETVPANTP